MSAKFFSKSIPGTYPKNDIVSSSSPLYLWNYFWIPIFFYLLKDLSSVNAQSTILLPSQRQHHDGFVNNLFTSEPRCSVPDPSLNYRPVIGILSHPGDGASGRLSNATNASYIAASYVKFVESGGARVIPLIYNEPEEIIFEVKQLSKLILMTFDVLFKLSE